MFIEITKTRLNVCQSNAAIPATKNPFSAHPINKTLHREMCGPIKLLLLLQIAYMEAIPPDLKHPFPYAVHHTSFYRHSLT